MPNIYDDYMTFVDTLESPTIYNEWCCMSVVAACAQRKIWLDPVVGSPNSENAQAHYKVAPNLYIVLVGPPGIGKDTAMNVARNIIADVKDIPTKSDSLTKEYIYKHMGGIVCDSHSPDRVWKITHSSLTIFSSEMSTLIKKNDRDFVGMLNYLFNTQPYANNSTKGQGEDSFPNPFLNILAGTTPDWISYNIREDVLEGGFAARTLFVFADAKSKSNPFPAISPSQRAARDRVVLALKQVASICQELHMTNDARDLYIQWYNKHSQSRPLDYRMLGYHGRRPAFVQKLSIIFTLMRNPAATMVEPCDISAAVMLLNKTEPRVEKALSGVGRNDLQIYANRILHQIAAAGGSARADAIQANNRADLKNAELAEVIKGLIQDRLITTVIKQTEQGPIVLLELASEIDRPQPVLEGQTYEGNPHSSQRAEGDALPNSGGLVLGQ